MIFIQITYSVSANVALTVAQTVTNIAGTPEKYNKNICVLKKSTYIYKWYMINNAVRSP